MFALLFYPSRVVVLFVLVLVCLLSWRVFCFVVGGHGAIVLVCRCLLSLSWLLFLSWVFCCCRCVVELLLCLLLFGCCRCCC